MPLSIKDPETDRLVRELAGVTGESITTAVARAVQERLDRVRASSRTADRRRVLTAIAERVAALPVVDDRPQEELVQYDEHGLPV
ncbi:type II toxin-antitoxin system VapB family antitoxin [Aquipuribacter nitratireducens]|uniref:Type II toxin-antitoxin system VapB family antitoxin n=1 Tax=Aquipuribacter nitratireducens TaxID=650104 RepID=A0ABW0GKB6_9MICO